MPVTEREGTLIDHVIIRRYSCGARRGLGAATGLLALVTALLISIFWADGWTAATVVMALIMLGLTAGAGLLTAASIWNTVRVQVVAGDVVVETGPVPWIRRRTIPGVSIEQLYVQQAPLEKTFVPRLGGVFDVQARLSDGRWIMIVRGCCTEQDAQRVERTVEQALRRGDEYGDADDDGRSEVFAGWREVLGVPPRWMRVERDGETVRIICRIPLPTLIGRAAALAVGAALGGYVLMQMRTFAFGVVVWGLIIVILLTRLVASLVSRQVLVVDRARLRRSTRGLLGGTPPVAIQRGMVEAVDCRSGTIIRRMGRLGSWRVRRYRVVAYNRREGHFMLMDDLHNRDGGLHVLNAIAEALEVDAQATRWSDEHGDSAAGGSGDRVAGRG